MPFYDLNVPHDLNAQELSRTLAFHAELGFTQIAMAISITGKIPPTPPSVPVESIAIPKSVSLLTRLTLHIHDPSQNHRLGQLQSAYNLIALRPTTQKALELCCNSLECDLISLDFSVRLGYPLKFKTVASALQRGIRFELCYSPGITSGSDARRNLISGATALIRATRGRGIIISGEARSALGLRGPWDIVNLAVVWGMSQERGKEAVCEEAGKVVQLARLKRESYRGVVDVLYGGEKVEAPLKEKDKTRLTNGIKRKAVDVLSGVSQTEETADEKPLSRNQKKKLTRQGTSECNADTPRDVSGAGKDLRDVESLMMLDPSFSYNGIKTTLSKVLVSSQTESSQKGHADEGLTFAPPILSVIALWSDNVLMLIVDTLERVEANSGAAVTDVLVEIEFERVANVVAVDEAGAKLMDLEEERGDEGDDEDDEVGGIDVMVEELVGGDGEAGVLAAGWVFALLEGAELAIDDCIDPEGGGADAPLDDAFGKNAGLKAMENAFAGQAQAQLQAWGGAGAAEPAAGIELFVDAGTTSTTIVEVPPCDCT